MSFSELLERALPLSPEILEGIATGTLQVFGGTIRDAGGRIVKHLVFPGDDSVGMSEMLKQELNRTLNQAQTEAINQLTQQTSLLSAVNILSARHSTEVLNQQLEALGSKIDELDQKATLLLEAARFSHLIQFSEIKSKALAAIEEAIYANQKQDDPRFIRLHIVPLRRAFSDLETLLTSLLNDLTNKQLIENIHFTMLIAELKNKAAFILGQTHIHLEEDDIAAGYFARNSSSNELLRQRLSALKTTGAFSPHILTREALEVLKSDIDSFKQLESQSLLLTSQNQLALALKVPNSRLLNNPFSQIQMLDPVSEPDDAFVSPG